MPKPLVLLLAATMLFSLYPAAAQQPNTLTGTILEAGTDNPVGYATVSLLRDSTAKSAVVAVAAEVNGRFSIKAPEPGKYHLYITMVGYTPYRQAVDVPAAGKALGNIPFTLGVEVSDVVIEVQKPLVMADAEKTTYSVEDDPQATTSTLDEIIRKVPQLSLDAEGNVLLNGQSNYKILLNGRNSATMSNNFKEVIQSMPASQISRIEVITNPSTKYEAEGVGGIINLITQKKKELYGYNGSVGGSITVLDNPSYNGNVNMSVQAGKFAASLMGYVGYYDWGHTPSRSESWQEHYESNNRYNKTSGVSRGSGTYGNVGLDMSYQPDTLNLITFSGWVWTGKNRNRSLSERSILDPDENPLMQYDGNSLSKWNYTGGSMALNYEHTFGKEEHTLTISDEVEIDPDTGKTDRKYTGGYVSRALQDEDNRMVGNTVQIDYNNPLTKNHKIEAGLKHIYRSSTTRTDIMQSDALGEFPDANKRYTDMDYRQHVLGIYAGYGFNFTKWSGRAGARIERTWNDADVDETDNGAYKFSNRQFNFVPYLSVTFVPKMSHNLSLSYTQRLQRPGIYMLSPATDDTDPTSISYGNPDLEAAVYHTINLQYSHYDKKWSVTFALNTFLSNNNMSSYTFSDPDGVINTTYSNDVRSRNYGFNGSLSYRPSQKLNLSFSFRGGYTKNDYDEMDIHTDRFTFNQNLNLDFALWKNARFMLGENYSTGHASLGSRSQSYYYYYMGIKQQLCKKKLDLSITCSNPFEKYRKRKNIVENPTYGGWSEYKYACRSLYFRISYRFGKQGVSVKRTARSIENDDMSGGSKGGGEGGSQGGGQ
ncbi:TonB-dependent receptor [uncultured Alistipes sp.]|uniref:TonB-dependent receptor domain-containing protein n=1 Tax=uncultured Alistipes sp. TaxID=538949 RepID=UPI0025F5E608|nr:TonB-dependent receptor [uncultured Alistipes sp.]